MLAPGILTIWLKLESLASAKTPPNTCGLLYEATDNFNFLLFLTLLTYDSSIQQDISAILTQLNPLPTDQGFPAGSKFYVFQEVIDQNDGAIKVDEYYDMGKYIK